MTAVNKLLDKAKKVCCSETDTALAARMHVSRAYLSSWRTGKDPMPDARIVEAANLAHDDAGAWLLAVREEQACGPTQRVWHDLRMRLAA